MPLVQKTFSDIITFDRASNATMFDSSGTLVYAKHNLLTYSEDFSNAAWTKQSSVSVTTNTTVAPDGTTTADTITADSGLGTYQLISANIGQKVTQSVYLRAGTATRIMFRDDTGAGRHIVVNPSTGVITSTSGTLIDFGSISMGNGWYRIYISYTADTTAIRAIIRPDSAGAGQTFIVWGGQASFYPVEGGVTGDLSTYYPTTSAAYQGPRFDYDPSTLAARGFLIEEQRTNSIRNNTMQGAVAGTPGTAPTNWVSTTAGGLTREIVGTGAANGITYIDIRYTGTPSATTAMAINFEANTGVAALQNQVWTTSTWAAIVGGTLTNITLFGFGFVERDSGGASVAAGLGFAFTPTSTLTRQSYTRTLSAATTAFYQPSLRFAFNDTVTPVDFTLRIGLPQLELGAFATSPIPTTTTALTRSADVASVNTLSPWFNASASTLYAEYQTTHITATQIAAAIADSVGSTNRATIGQTTTSHNAAMVDGGVVQASLTQGTASTNITKTAFAFALDDFAYSVNGSPPATDTSGTVSSAFTEMTLGRRGASTSPLTGYLRRITYYPRRLSNAELQSLTS